MSRLRRAGGGFLIFGGTAMAFASCAQDVRDFDPPAGEGGEGGEVGSTGGSAPTGGQSNTGGGGEGGDGSSTGGGSTGGSGGGSGGGTMACTDELPNGDECGGTCEPCPDGLSCDRSEDCLGDVCTSAGECCTPVDEVELCEGRCGMMETCEEGVVCGSCVGEASCNDDNRCGCPAAPCAIFSASYGDANQQSIGGLAVDGGGSVFLAGNFRGTLVFGNTTLTSVNTTSDDMFLVKFDPMGVPLWAASFGDAAGQEVRGLAVDGAGNVILVGRSSGTVNFGGSDLVTSSDLVIAKFNGMGAHQFSEAYGDYNVQPQAVAIDAATGEILVTGYFYDTLKFGSLATMVSNDTANGYYDTFMVRFSAAGVPQFSKRVGSGLDEYAESGAMVGSYAYLVGTFSGTLDFGSPNPTALLATGWSDLFVAKLGKASFSHVWSKRFGNDGSGGYAVDTPRVVVDPPSGDVLVAGNFTGTMELNPVLSTTGYEMFVARLASTDGAGVWAEQYENAELGALAFGPDGHLYLAGRATGDIDFGGGTRQFSGTDDVFIAKLDLNGDHVYSRVFGSPTGVQYAEGIGVTPGREAWIAARFDGQLELGLGPLQTQGGNDIAIGKYAP